MIDEKNKTAESQIQTNEAIEKSRKWLNLE